jgi:hypothetical protein
MVEEPDLSFYQNNILNPYTQLMEEIKRRQAVIGLVFHGQVSLPAIVAVELCYLQLRFISELIALGCLVAHGDIQATRGGRLRDVWAADRIINSLEKLHADFYPRPTKQVIGTDRRPKSVEPITSGYLTKSDLLKLNHECGSFLHRGNLKGVFSATIRKPNLDVINDWTGKITLLLNHHQIQLINPDLMIWTLMQGSADGRVHSTLMQRRDGASSAD